MNNGYERQLSEMYRASAQEEPPESIDNMILATARRELRGSTRIAIRWSVPLALAAVIVLSVSLVAVMRDASQLSGKSLKTDRQQQSSPVAAQPGTPSVVADEAEQRRETALQKRAKGEQAPVGLTRSGKLDWDRAERPSSPGQAKEIAVPVPSSVGSGSASKKSAPAPLAIRPLDATEQLHSNVAKPDERQSVPVQEPARSRVNAYNAAAVSSADGQQSKASSAEQSAIGPAPRAAAETAPRADVRADHALSPEQWLERIERLRREGKAAEAQASLDAFRKRFPEYPLPAALTKK